MLLLLSRWLNPSSRTQKESKYGAGWQHSDCMFNHSKFCTRNFLKSPSKH